MKTNTAVQPQLRYCRKKQCYCTNANWHGECSITACDKERLHRNIYGNTAMRYCPNCNNILRWYLKYIGGIARENWHCDRCGYDTMTIKTIMTNRTDWKGLK